MVRKAVSLFFVLAVWASAQIVPGMFIVEMAEAPKGSRQAGVNKASARQAIEQSSGRIVDSFDTVMNALVVRTAGDDPSVLAAMPGVGKVYRVVEGKRELDGAVPLHKAIQAWERAGGYDRAGAGIKIGMIDTGIQVSHPGFKDDTLPSVEGFPKGNRESDLKGTSKKIIVARSYENLLSLFDEPTTADVVGHGTGTAMAAAGIRHKAPFGEITGIAPRAYLGAYKVFTANGGTNSSVVIRAIEDAVNDGMNVISISLGFVPALRPSEDPVVRAVERAAEAGVLTVKSAGNYGPDPGTGSSPSAAPSIISVGANWNQRVLISTATVGSEPPYVAVPADAPIPAEPVQAPLFDVAKIDGTGRACDPLPEASLTGKIAFIFRGDCFFEVKLNNAQRAGAVGALVYTHSELDFSVMVVGEAKLPGMMMRYEDGLKVKKLLTGEGEFTAVLRFEGAPFPVDPNEVVEFSSRGPTDLNDINPDLVATGAEVYTATENTDPQGEIYSENGYVIVDGTSFSAPMVSGAAAVVMSARPGLKLRQYRSLIINSARPITRLDGTNEPIQSQGSGMLDVDASLKATTVAYPTSISFGAGDPTANITRDLEITNVSTVADTYTVTILPFGESPAPELGVNSFFLEPNQTRKIAVRWNKAGLRLGEHQGFLLVRGTNSDAEMRIPYWYAATARQPRNITIFSGPASARANTSVNVDVRVTDVSGVILTEFEPQVTVERGDGFSAGVVSLDASYPGMWRLRLRLGQFAGTNTFKVTAGDTSITFSIRGT